MWPFKKKKKENFEGVMLRNELLYTISKLGLIPYWLDIGDGMKMGVGSMPPRKLKEYDTTWFPK